jgi:hypothetical protein
MTRAVLGLGVLFLVCVGAVAVFVSLLLTLHRSRIT